MENKHQDIDIKDWYISRFNNFEAGLNGDSQQPFHKIRKKALEKFTALGFPSGRIEDWKYTNISPILQHQFDLAKSPSQIDKDQIKNFLIDDIKNVLVFINGQFTSQFSSVKSEHPQLSITSLAEAFKENSDVIKTYLTRYADFDTEPFTALNTAFATEGAFIHIPDNYILEDPIQLLYISDPCQTTFQSHPRNLIIIGKGGQGKILESHHHLSENTYFHNSVSEIVLNENAMADHFKIQDDSKQAFRIAKTQIYQKEKSTYNSVSIDLGGAIVRNNLGVCLDGENCESNLFGFYFVSGKQHIDNHTNIDHLQPNCDSNELYKGILAEKSRGVFSGTIYVAKDAQKTNAFQSNKNLLLSEEAEIDSKPQLKIYADDVKCSHGATIGQLDENALFYLQQRGINKKEAQTILRSAFAGEVLERISIKSLRERIRDTISNRLIEKL
jgi:Fe-S cluster assembly protein SufD